MLFPKKPQTVRKGERAQVLYRFSNSLDMTYRFTAEPANPGDEVGGTVEVRGSRWIFSKSPVTQPLERDNAVHKGMWDTFYAVHVEPDCDVTIIWERSSLGGATTLIFLVSLIIGIALVSVLFSIYL